MQPVAGYLHFPAAAMKLQALPAWQMMKKQKFASLRQPTTLNIAASSASQRMTFMALSWCWWSFLAFDDPAVSDIIHTSLFTLSFLSASQQLLAQFFGQILPAAVLMHRQLIQSKKHTADCFSFGVRKPSHPPPMACMGVGQCPNPTSTTAPVIGQSCGPAVKVFFFFTQLMAWPSPPTGKPLSGSQLELLMLSLCPHANPLPRPRSPLKLAFQKFWPLLVSVRP